MPTLLVIDTNIALDLLVFQDPHTLALRQGLETRALRWLATGAMRDELARVLDYPQVARRREFYQRSVAQVLAQFDALTERMETAPKAPMTCKDADDQKFIDLAVQHQAPLLSKDHAVLCMKKRLPAGVFSNWSAI